MNNLRYKLTNRSYFNSAFNIMQYIKFFLNRLNKQCFISIYEKTAQSLEGFKKVACIYRIECTSLTSKQRSAISLHPVVHSVLEGSFRGQSSKERSSSGPLVSPMSTLLSWLSLETLQEVFNCNEFNYTFTWLYATPKDNIIRILVLFRIINSDEERDKVGN